MCSMCVCSSADLPKPQCHSSVQCQLERGRNVRQLFAERSTAATVWCQSWDQESSHSDLGSECQGYSPAVAINKWMRFYSGSGGFVVLLFKCLFLESAGKSRGQLCGCLLCEGLWQLVHILQCWKRKHHVFQEEFSSTIACFPWTMERIF